MLYDLIQSGLESGRMAFGLDETWRPAEAVAAPGLDFFGEGAASSSVGVLLTNDEASVQTLLGAIASGVRLVSLPLPPRGGDLEVYASAMRQACRQHGVEEVIVRDDVAPLLGMIGVQARAHADLGRRPVAVPSESGFELVQYTSGSTGSPKAVLLSGDAIEANIRAVLDRISPTSSDRVVTWLPLSHDLGLIAMLLAPIVGGGREWAEGGDLMIVEPERFLRDPSTWMQAVSSAGGTITAGPDFALRMATERSSKKNLDLSRLRCLIVGGEIVRADTLRSFSAEFEYAHFDENALCPAYGLAEVGVAMSLTAPDEHWRSIHTTYEAVAEARRTIPRGDEVVLEIVASGTKLPGYDILVAEQDAVGMLSVSGPSMGVDGLTGESFADARGWLRTGDVGFVEADHVYVCGRGDDYIVAYGRNIYAPFVETAVSALEYVRSGRVTAIGLPSGEWIVVAEAVRNVGDAARHRLTADIRRSVVNTCGIQPDEVVVLEAGRLPMTPSGKLQRNELRRRYLAAQLV